MKTWFAAAVAAIGLAATPAAAAQGPAAGAPAAAAEDVLRVTLCGTSGPAPVRARAKPCVAVEAGGALYLVDIGPEATENLMLYRLPLAKAQGVFITHLHSDHIGELGEFNMQSWVAGRPQALPVYGPAGVEKLVQGFNLAYENDHGYRRAHHERGPFKFSIAAGELAARAVRMPAAGQIVVLQEGGLKVTAIAIDHRPVQPAFAYRFDYKGRSVVVSGDTRKHPPLAEAARGADILIHEAQNAEMMRQLSQALTASGNGRMGSLFNDTLSYHTTPAEAADIARAAGVKMLILSHLTQAGQPMYSPEAFTRGVEAGGPLAWKLAEDGMTIDLPAGKADIRFSQR